MKANKAKMQKQPAMFKREFKDDGVTMIHQIIPNKGQPHTCAMRCGTRNGMSNTGTLEIDTISNDIEYSTVQFDPHVQVTRCGMLEWSITIGEYFKTIGD